MRELRNGRVIELACPLHVEVSGSFELVFDHKDTQEPYQTVVLAVLTKEPPRQLLFNLKDL